MKYWPIRAAAVLALAMSCQRGVTLTSPLPTATAHGLTPSPTLTPTPADLSASPLSAIPLTAGDDFLDTLARDTWTYLSSDWSTDNHLPWSWRSATLSGGDYANPTEIGLYALSRIATYEMQRPWSPSWPQVETEVSAVFDQLRAWQTGSQAYQPNGPNAYNNSVFYQWYWINWSQPVVGGTITDHVVPSVDNAWLAASLITIREYGETNGHTTLAQKAEAILGDMNFMLWYHTDTHRFTWGAQENPQGGIEAAYYSDENRIINFIARALGQLSAEEFRLSLAALAQPTGTYDSITVGKVNCDGSYFTYTAPALFIDEARTIYGLNSILPAAQAQIAYAQNQGYAAWGLSDAYDVGAGGYIQQGAPPAACGGAPETHPGVVTPHASALALLTPLASQAITNLQTISNTFPAAYEPLRGFRDSVMAKPGDPQYGVPSDRFSALAQEWLFLSIVNHETGFIWNYFYRDEGVRQADGEMSPRLYLPHVTRGGTQPMGYRTTLRVPVWSTRYIITRAKRRISLLPLP